MSKEKLAKKIARIQHRLTEMGSLDALREQLTQLESDINRLTDELRVEVSAAASLPGLRERLEAKLEHLLAKKEHQELRIELHQDRRERLQETLEELQSMYESGDALNSSSHVNVGKRMRSSHPSKQMTEERRKILDMLHEGKITVDEATQLLNALGLHPAKTHVRQDPRWVRIRVTDTDTGHTRVNLTFPIGLVRAGLKAGGSIAGIVGVNTSDLEERLNRGEIGHIVDYHDEMDGARVEVFVE